MFIKPYRLSLSDDAHKSSEAWLMKDMDAAPPHILESLTSHVDSIVSDRNITYFITPVFRQIISRIKPPHVSFKYSNSADFIFRDLAFGETITKSMLAVQLFNHLDDALHHFFNKLLSIDYFLTGQIQHAFDRTYMDSNVRFHKSFIVGLNSDAKSVHDIDYVDILFDDQPDIMPTDKSPNLCPELVKRIGISLRFYLQPNDASFKTVQENVNCISVRDEASILMNPVFNVNSMEYYFETYYQDIDSVLIQYLNANKELLANRLGYEPNIIDKNVLNVIDMITI